MQMERKIRESRYTFCQITQFTWKFITETKIIVITLSQTRIVLTRDYIFVINIFCQFIHIILLVDIYENKNARDARETKRKEHLLASERHRRRRYFCFTARR